MVAYWKSSISTGRINHRFFCNSIFERYVARDQQQVCIPGEGWRSTGDISPAPRVKAATKAIVLSVESAIFLNRSGWI